MRKKAIPVIIIIIAVIAAAAVLAFVLLNRNESTDEFYAMDTRVNITLDAKNSDEIFGLVKETVNHLDKDLLSRTEKNSMVSKINKKGKGRIDPSLVGYIMSIIKVGNATNELFDYTMGDISDLWGFGTDSPSVPDAEELKEAVQLHNRGAVYFTAASQELTLYGQKMSLDFGSVGKGIALDKIRTDCLEGKEVKRCVAAVGGSVLLYGKGKFKVGIQDPEGPGYIAVLNLPACCVSTSGNYERYFEEGGKKYHHILDPNTGYPVNNGLVSVTVISDSGTLTDALSTACFVMGKDNGIGICKQFGSEGIFITEDKKIYTDAETAEYITVTDSSYELVTENEE